jgi:hypothetical protein
VFLKIYISLLALAIGGVCNAQVIMQFEQWEQRQYGSVPATTGFIRWTSSDTINGLFQNLITDRPNVIVSTNQSYGTHSGDAALCIQQNYYKYGNDSGFVGGGAYIGTYDPIHFKFEPVAFSGRPSHVVGYHKIVGNANLDDTANITFLLFDQFDAVIGTASKIFKHATSGNNFHQFSLPVTYANNDPVAKVLGKFEVGVLDIVNKDTTFKMIIDDVDFVYPNYIDQQNLDAQPKVYYSVDGNFIQVVPSNQMKNYNALLINTYGQQVASFADIANQKISTSNLSSGNYFFVVVDQDNNKQVLSFVR